MQNVEDIDDTSEHSTTTSVSTSSADSSSASSDAPCKEMDEIKNDFIEYLDAVGQGTYATSGTFSPTNPGLSVHGLGKVGLPLSERDAQDIINISKRTASINVGINDDATARTTCCWELGSSQVVLRNPAWDMTVNETVQKVAETLGVVGGVGSIRVDLHILLLCEKGGFFSTSTL